MLDRLRSAPITVPMLACAAIVAWWTLASGGFAVSVWAPGGLVLVGLLAAALVAIPTRVSTLPRTVLLAAGALGAYTAWSFASIAWAADPGGTAPDANRA